MQTYPIQLAGTNPSQTVAVHADLFVYESADIKKRTNLVVQSNQFDAATWTLYQASIVADATTAPDGTQTADRVANNGALEQSVKASAAFTAGQVYTGSVYAKAGERSVFSAMLSSAMTGGSGGSATFDLVAGTVSTAGCTAKIVDAGNGWWRCSWTYTAGTTSAGMIGAFWINLGISAFDTTQGAYFWGAQLETGVTATPLIPTLSTTVTAQTGDSRIKVKAENGAEVVLKPGQRVRIVGQADRWNITSYDGITPMTVNAILGSGEFDDANTMATVKFDSSSSAVAVNVTNPVQLAGAEIEIKNDAGNRIPVTLDVNQILQTSGATVQVQKGWSSAAVQSVGTTTIVTAGQNVNGMIINKTILPYNQSVGYDNGFFVTNGTDQVYLNYASGNAGLYGQSSTSDVQYLIPAGWSLVLQLFGSGQAGFRYVGYTLK